MFHDNYHGSSDVDVITSDDIRPQGGAYGDTFELVVTAAQNFGGDAAAPPPPVPVATGRPYVIPVDIDQIRGEGASPSSGDDYVSIDGRKTYFNLAPTDAGAATVPPPPAGVFPTSALPYSIEPTVSAVVLCMFIH